MAEHEPGHPDELQQQLANWLAEATSPIGALPEGMTAAEWAARNFIDSWRKPLRLGIDSIENQIAQAITAIRGNQSDLAVRILDGVRQEIAETLRDELGIYEWNREED